jgi:hypothetical protein
MTPEVNYIQKTPLPPAMYHGANSFAKENNHDRIHAGFGCTGAASDTGGTSA